MQAVALARGELCPDVQFSAGGRDSQRKRAILYQVHCRCKSRSHGAEHPWTRWAICRRGGIRRAGGDILERRLKRRQAATRSSAHRHTPIRWPPRCWRRCAGGAAGGGTNGLGERAGNASLEEVLMGFAPARTFTAWRITCILANCTASAVYGGAQRRGSSAQQAGGGANAFVHQERRISTMLKPTATYEIMKPENWAFLRRKRSYGRHTAGARHGAG